MNYVRTAVLLAALTALLMGIGYLLGGRGGALIAFFVAAATNFFAYWNGDRLVLSLHGAHEVDEHTAPELVCGPTRRSCRTADAACLSHGQPAAERLRDRAQSAACRGRVDDRVARHALAR